MSTDTALTKWVPTTNLQMLRRMGKLCEELGELNQVAARCIIQGVDEVDPASGKVNRQRLLEEIGDVLAQCDMTIEALRLDPLAVHSRRGDKVCQMRQWEAMFKGDTP